MKYVIRNQYNYKVYKLSRSIKRRKPQDYLKPD